MKTFAIYTICLSWWLVSSAQVLAQNSSLYQRVRAGNVQAPLTLENGSWHFQQVTPPRELRRNDLVTILVDVKSRAIAEGEMERRKTSSFDAVLSDWIKLRSLDDLEPASQSAGDPSISGTLNSLFRAEGELETRENVSFTVTASVADIRPNGNLVLEAHADVQINDESWQYSLSGICRTEDIGPDNIILSNKLAELRVHKREYGAVRDAYRRGWLLKAWHKVKAF